MSKLIRNGLLLVVACTATASHTVQAQGVLPTFQCTMTDKLDLYNWPGSIKDTFVQNTPVIYFICDSDNARTGDKIKAVWIADHTSTTHPEIYTLAASTYHVRLTQNDGVSSEADLSLKRPPCGWARGEYHVQVYINDIEGYVYRFKIR